MTPPTCHSPLALRLAVLLLAVALLVPGCDDPPAPEAPLFVLPSDGADPCDLEAQRPKLVFLVFWHHSCPYCRAEVEELHELADGLDPDQVVLYAVHVDGGAAAAAEAAPLMAHPNIRICWDDGTVSSRYAELPSPWRLQYIPHMMWVDADGIARRPHTGVTPASTLKADMKKLLAETPSEKTGL
jgi:thiol-disulfide isomerase/thioredoxin